VKAQPLIALLVAAQMTLGVTAPGIGVAIADREFQVNGIAQSGRVDVVDGAQIRTGLAPATVDLNNGARIELAARSQGRLFQNRLLLTEGAGQFATPTDFAIEALSLRVVPLTPNASGRVALHSLKKLELAALAGIWSVANSEGVVIAKLAPGTALEFQLPEKTNPASNTDTPAKMTGCLQKKDGHYLLKDETTNVTAELQAAEPQSLEKEVRHHIQIVGNRITGATPVKHATQLIGVSDVKRLSKHCAFPAALLAGGGIATAAVIAGIVIGTGAVVGTIIAVGSNPPPAVSPSTP
jgi:high-affinity K+ transport system ATPase subunit B